MVKTAAKVTVIRASLLPVRWRARIARVSPECTPLLGRRRCLLGTWVEDDHPFDDGPGDVRHSTEALVVGEDLLRERDEGVSLGDEVPDGVHEVLGAEIVRALLIEVEERVPPDHEDERLRWRDGSGAQRGLAGLGSIEIQLDHSHEDHLTNPGIGTSRARSSAERRLPPLGPG